LSYTRKYDVAFVNEIILPHFVYGVNKNIKKIFVFYNFSIFC